MLRMSGGSQADVNPSARGGSHVGDESQAVDWHWLHW